MTYFEKSLISSKLYDNIINRQLVVKGVIMPPGDIIGIQIKGVFPFKNGDKEIKINLIYSITDNSINPV